MKYVQQKIIKKKIKMMFSNTFPSGSYMWSLFQLDKPNTESFWRRVKD